jgi:hypothetical protein
MKYRSKKKSSQWGKIKGKTKNDFLDVLVFAEELLTAREQASRSIPQPSKTDIRNTWEALQPDEEKYLANIQLYRKEVYEDLKALARALSSHTPTDRIVVCTTHLRQTLDFQLLAEVYRLYREHHIPGFCRLYDYESGVSYLISQLENAVLEVEGGAAPLADLIAEKKKGEQKEDVREVAAKKEVHAILRQESKRMAMLLKQDPTGFAIVDKLMNEIQEYMRTGNGIVGQNEGIVHIFSYQTPELVLAGARFARNAYKILYPLSAT